MLFSGYYIVHLVRLLVCHAQLPVLGPKHCIRNAPWCTPVIKALKSGRQEDYKFKVILTIEQISDQP